LLTPGVPGGAGAGIKAARLVTKVDDVAKAGSSARKADFYVKPNGDAIPSTGYRYMDSNASYLNDLKKNMTIPENNKGTYISFDKLDTPNPGKLQVPHDASYRGTFDTLQVVDDLKIPKGDWGKSSHLEPITETNPKFGSGGATQAVTSKEIKLDRLENLSGGAIVCNVNGMEFEEAKYIVIQKFHNEKINIDNEKARMITNEVIGIIDSIGGAINGETIQKVLESLLEKGYYQL